MHVTLNLKDGVIPPMDTDGHSKVKKKKKHVMRRWCHFTKSTSSMSLSCTRLVGRMPEQMFGWNGIVLLQTLLFVIKLYCCILPTLKRHNKSIMEAWHACKWVCCGWGQGEQKLQDKTFIFFGKSQQAKKKTKLHGQAHKASCLLKKDKKQTTLTSQQSTLI